MAEMAGLETAPNFRSHKVLVDILYKCLGLKILRVTDHGAPSTAKPVLMELRTLSPWVEKLLEHKRYSKLRSAYTMRWLKILGKEPRAYFAEYRQIGTDTGRLSGDFQQVPRVVEGEPNIRNAVAAPPGMTLLELDYDQIELRFIAWRAREETLLRLYREGADVHAFSGRMLFGIHEQEGILNPAVRRTGKTTNFGLSYEAGSEKLAEIMLLSLTPEDIAHVIRLLRVATLHEAAAQLHWRWHSTFPGVRRWHAEEKAQIARRGYALAPHGRIKHLPFLRSKDPKERAPAFRDGINHTIQSPASDLCLLAATMAAPTMYGDLGAVAGPWPSHDSLLWLIRGDVRPAGAYLRQVMEQDAVRRFEDLFGLEIDLPITVGLKAGIAWGSLDHLTT